MKRFLSVAYGAFDASENNFLIHTYLSVFAKMLAYTVVSNDDYIDDAEVLGIIDGSIFHQYNIGNFVDNDFYHWIKRDASFHALKKVFRLIAQELSGFDFQDVDEDILKGVYQELIDLDTRHALGEYYTPDWLCERVVNEFEFAATDKILDPACGSGSFLRAAIDRLKRLNPAQTAEKLSEQIYGIDIHPLSVQIAKTTLLLAFGKEIVKAKKPVQLNILLANTLLAPKGVGDMFGNQFTMDIDKRKLPLTTDILEDARLFDEAINICEELAEQTVNKDALKSAVIANSLKINLTGKSEPSAVADGLAPNVQPPATADGSDLTADKNRQIVESFHQIYLGFKAAKESGRDSIWKFIVQNLYKPYFLHDKFDYVIGNPPWFTYKDVKNEDYQKTLNVLAKEYNVMSSRIANFPNLEIAAIFLAYCSSYFLKKEGRLAFVLPRSFFNGDQHDNTRFGKAKGFGLTEIWDLEKVKPLFNILSCVLFARKAYVQNPFPKTGLNGKSFSGALSAKNQNLQNATPLLTEENVKWFYVKQGKGSAFSTRQSKSNPQTNPYKKLFKKGAELTPRTFYFVELNQEIPPDFKDRIMNVRTAESVKPDAKKPWKELSFSGKIESQFLFRTALSKSVLPFALLNPNLVVLPITTESNKAGDKIIKLHSANDLLEKGYLNTAKWFQKAEQSWTKHRTQRNDKIGAVDYLNWHDKLTGQNLNARYLVIYNSSAKDANATLIKRDNLDLEFIVDTVTYVLHTNSLNEAYYLTAILNSTAPNKLMKDFQSKGLFGARHVHKKILDIYYPRFNAKDETHLRLAELSEMAHRKTSAFLADTPPNHELTAMRLGKLRLDIKRHLAEEMRQIDELVEKIIA